MSFFNRKNVNINSLKSKNQTTVIFPYTSKKRKNWKEVTIAFKIMLINKDKIKKQAPKIFLNKAEELDSINYDEQSDRESVQNFLRTYQVHEQNIKLALAKALASILDGHKSIIE